MTTQVIRINPQPVKRSSMKRGCITVIHKASSDDLDALLRLRGEGYLYNPKDKLVCNLGPFCESVSIRHRMTQKADVCHLFATFCLQEEVARAKESIRMKASALHYVSPVGDKSWRKVAPFLLPLDMSTPLTHSLS